MFVYESKLKVRYIETDQMGIVHHANYAQYYELARTECFEACSGMSYAAMEAEGVMLPIVELQSKYLKPIGEALRLGTMMAGSPAFSART